MEKVSAEVVAVETLVDAMVAALVQPSPPYLAVVDRMIARFASSALTVPLKDAAHELGVTIPTVNDWIARGVLRDSLSEVPRQRHRRAVTALSLATVLAAKGSAGEDVGARPLAAIVERLQDEELLARARRVAAAGDPTTLITYSDEDLAELENL